MDLKALEDIGLTANEAKTYISLCRAGSISAGKLTKRLEIHRSRVYEALERLAKMGLVTSITINNVKQYRSQSPQKLIDLVEEKKENIELFIPKIQAMQEEKSSTQRVNAYQGSGGIKNLLQLTLKVKEYLVFGAPTTSVDLLGKTFWKNYNQKIVANNIKTKMIFDESLREWSKEVKKINKLSQIKYLSKHFDNLTETFVLDESIIIITWSAQPLGVLIADKTIANSYRQFFKMLWQQATP